MCIASIWISNNLIAAYVLMVGVAFSRLGLWMFDLSVIQLMQARRIPKHVNNPPVFVVLYKRLTSCVSIIQDQVPESDRCVVGGVQNSLQSVLDLMTYIMGIIISNPQVKIY